MTCSYTIYGSEIFIRVHQLVFIGHEFITLVPRVFSLFKMAAAREKTLAYSRSRVSNEDGDVFKMAATAKRKRVRRTGYEMWLR